MRQTWAQFAAVLLFAGTTLWVVIAAGRPTPIVLGQREIANDYIGGFHGADVYRITDGPVVCYLTKHPEHPNTSISCVVIAKGK
jgi:hypothetical protein